MLIVTDAAGPTARLTVSVLPWYSSFAPCSYGAVVVAVPENTYWPAYWVFASCLTLSVSCSTSSAIVFEVALVVGAVGGLAPAVRARAARFVHVRHRARWPCSPRRSRPGRCFRSRSGLRAGSAGRSRWLAPYGLSDGSRIVLPEDSSSVRPFERRERGVEVVERRARDHRGGDPLAHRYSPTTPVCSISVSSISSIAVSVRAEAW